MTQRISSSIYLHQSEGTLVFLKRKDVPSQLALFPARWSIIGNRHFQRCEFPFVSPDTRDESRKKRRRKRTRSYRTLWSGLFCNYAWLVPLASLRTSSIIVANKRKAVSKYFYWAANITGMLKIPIVSGWKYPG